MITTDTDASLADQVQQQQVPKLGLDLDLASDHS